MLHFCSGLQHVQDLEENEKDDILISSTEYTDTDIAIATTATVNESIDDHLDVE